MFEFDFKNNLGGMGIFGMFVVNKVICDVDLVIGIGMCYIDFIISFKMVFDLIIKFININVSCM